MISTAMGIATLTWAVMTGNMILFWVACFWVALGIFTTAVFSVD